MSSDSECSVVHSRAALEAQAIQQQCSKHTPHILDVKANAHESFTWRYVVLAARREEGTGAETHMCTLTMHAHVAIVSWYHRVGAQQCKASEFVTS